MPFVWAASRRTISPAQTGHWHKNGPGERDTCSSWRPAPPGRIHYGWIVAATTFLVLLITAGLRAAPGVLSATLLVSGSAVVVFVVVAISMRDRPEDLGLGPVDRAVAGRLTHPAV